MKRKKSAENDKGESPKPKKYKKKIENPEKQKVRYVYDNKGESGKIWEKNRRDRLNKTFDDLSDLLPNKVLKMSKIDILSGSIKHILELLEKIKKIEGSTQETIIATDTKKMVDAGTETEEEEKENIKPANEKIDFEVQCDLIEKPVLENKEIQTEEVEQQQQQVQVEVKTNQAQSHEEPSVVPYLSSSLRVTPALVSTPIMTPTLYQPQNDLQNEKKKVSPITKKIKTAVEGENQNFEELSTSSRYSIENLQQTTATATTEKCSSRVRKNLMADLPLPNLQDNEIENEIMEALSVPQIPVSSASVSPTVAYLVSFPIVSSGKQIGEENNCEEPEKGKVGENLNDSSTRTLMDIENFFPSHLLNNNEPALSPVVSGSANNTNKKGPIPFDSPLKDSSDKVALNFQKYPPHAYPSTIPSKLSVETQQFSENSKKSPSMKYSSSNYYHHPIVSERLTPPTYTQYNPSIFSTSTFNSNDRYIQEQPSNFTFCLTTASKTDPKYSSSGGSSKTVQDTGYYPHMDKKAQSTTTPYYHSSTKYHSNQQKNRCSFYIDPTPSSTLPLPKPKTPPPPPPPSVPMLQATGSSCAKSAPDSSKSKRNCQQQQSSTSSTFSSKYDINWMTSSEFKSNTPDLSLLGSFDYFNQPSTHYPTTSLDMNRKELYFAHPTEESSTWSPSKLTNDSMSFVATNQYHFTPTLPNLHGDLALNDPVKINKTSSSSKKPSNGSSSESNSNFLSVHQLMNHNNNHHQTHKPPIRTKAEKKSMPSYCEMPNFNESRSSYNYSAEALINTRTSNKTSNYPHIDSSNFTSTNENENFYSSSAANGKCDSKPVVSSFPAPFMEPPNLYQSSCLSRTQSNFSYQESYSTVKPPPPVVPPPPPSSSYQKSYLNPPLKGSTSSSSSKHNNNNNNNKKSYGNEFSIAQEPAYGYNQASFNYSSKASSSYNFNIQSVEGFPGSGNRGNSTVGSTGGGTTSNSIHHHHQHQNTGQSLTNFNVSAIFPEINEKVRSQQNW